MRKLTNSIMDFIRQAIAVSIVGSFLFLIAGEVRLAALKKASQRSTKISGFTQKMTKTKLSF